MGYILESKGGVTSGLEPEGAELKLLTTAEAPGTHVGGSAAQLCRVGVQLSRVGADLTTLKY